MGIGGREEKEKKGEEGERGGREEKGNQEKSEDIIFRDPTVKHPRVQLQEGKSEGYCKEDGT